MYGISEFLAVVERVSEGTGSSPLSTFETLAAIDERHVLTLLEAPFIRIGGHLLYPNPIQQAAILGSRIIQLSMLGRSLDLLVALVFVELALEEADFELDAPTTELDLIFRSIAARTTSDDQFIKWLMGHTRPSRTLS